MACTTTGGAPSIERGGDCAVTEKSAGACASAGTDPVLAGDDGARGAEENGRSVAGWSDGSAAAGRATSGEDGCKGDVGATGNSCTKPREAGGARLTRRGEIGNATSDSPMLSTKTRPWMSRESASAAVKRRSSQNGTECASPQGRETASPVPGLICMTMDHPALTARQGTARPFTATVAIMVRPPPPHVLDPAQTITSPLILVLDQNGVPQRWIHWQTACFYYARELVAWTVGAHDFIFHGGISRLTGERSHITANSIIALRGRVRGHLDFTRVPPLNNRELFHRDRYLCAYCGLPNPASHLTRDHITPVSRGGRDVWMNVVTACRDCNQKKDCRTPEEARMQLLYAPYVPNRAEFLILSNRHILADQMDFLARHVPAKSRLHAEPA